MVFQRRDGCATRDLLGLQRLAGHAPQRHRIDAGLGLAGTRHRMAQRCACTQQGSITLGAIHRQPTAGLDLGHAGMKVRLTRLAQAQVGRLRMFDEISHAGAHLHRVARRRDQHVRKAAHQRVVLHRVVRVAQSAIGQPAADGNHGHRQAVVVHVVADLLGAAEGGEVGDRIGEDVIALAGHARGQARHVLLGHAGVDEAVRELVGKGFHHGVAEVTDDQRDVRVLARQRHQFFDESLTHESAPVLRAPWPVVRRSGCGNATRLGFPYSQRPCP